MDEQEIETVMVLSKKLKLRTVSGQLISGSMDVFECESPYVMIILVDTEQGHSLRMDVHKEDLASELRCWLEGKQIRNPAVLVHSRIEEAIGRFVKFGNTPLQEDLIMWMLSRSELYLGQSPSLMFGGSESNEHNIHDDVNISNEFSKTAMAALKAESLHDLQYRIDDINGNGNRPRIWLGGIVDDEQNFKITLQSKQSNIRSGMFNTTEDQGMFAITRKLLGRSATLDMAKKTRVKGREGARQTISTPIWNSENHLLVAEVEKARKKIETAMDERRRMIEIAKTRQLQASDKYRKIRTSIAEEHGANQFKGNAMEELISLQKMEGEIYEDIRRQKNRAQRTAQKVAWTMAPQGFQNRRGKSQRGPVLGPGPLHPNATSRLRDPRIDSTVRRYYWDSAGRRHIRDAHNSSEDGGGEDGSLVEKALEAIRKASANISAFKLDLKAVFEKFDTSGDGFLSAAEMAEAFFSMGVQLDMEAMDAIFKHFDPNDSGAVHYGEFVWAFFNRRKLVRQWKHKTNNMTETAIREKFHLADTNGDGKLNNKEFQKLLKSFGMTGLSPSEIDILMKRFDEDGDGNIDLDEFRVFIESEQRNLAEAEGTAPSAASSLFLPSKSKHSTAASTPRPSISQRHLNNNTQSRHMMMNSSANSSSNNNNNKTNTSVPVQNIIYTTDKPTSKSSQNTSTISASKSLYEEPSYANLRGGRRSSSSDGRTRLHSSSSSSLHSSSVTFINDKPTLLHPHSSSNNSNSRSSSHHRYHSDGNTVNTREPFPPSLHSQSMYESNQYNNNNYYNDSSGDPRHYSHQQHRRSRSSSSLDRRNHHHNSSNNNNNNNRSRRNDSNVERVNREKATDYNSNININNNYSSSSGDNAKNQKYGTYPPPPQKHQQILLNNNDNKYYDENDGLPVRKSLYATTPILSSSSSNINGNSVGIADKNYDTNYEDNHVYDKLNKTTIDDNNSSNYYPGNNNNDNMNIDASNNNRTVNGMNDKSNSKNRSQQQQQQTTAVAPSSSSAGWRAKRDAEINNRSNSKNSSSSSSRSNSSSEGSMGLEEELDALWIARILQAQAEVEARLGKRYY